MKSLYIAAGLFFSVIVFLTVNYFCINSLLDYTMEQFDKTPESVDEIEQMNEAELDEIKKILDDIKEKWDSKENYVCMSLNHETSREFMEQLMSAISFFESEEYPEFLSEKDSATDSLDHMKFDEGFKFGNVF